MTQRGPASRSNSAPAWTRVRTLVALLALGTAAAWGRVPTTATHTRPAKLRHAASQESFTPQHSSRKTPIAAHKAQPHTAKATASAHHRAPQPEARHEPTPIKRAALDRTPRAITPRAQPALAKTTTGGELTTEDFFRAAGASPEAKGEPVEDTPAPAPAAEKLQRGESHPPSDDRVVPLPAAKSVPRTTASAHIVTAPAAQPTLLLDEAADPVPASALTDARVTALTHPSHEEMAEEAAAPVLLPGLYRNGRLVVPPPLKGSREVLVHQNLMADDEGLERIRDDYALNRLRAAHQLVPLPESASLHLNPELGADRRCARVWTVKFAADTARAFYARFHEPLQVNSAVRTIAYQVRLQRTNGNAAGIGGDVASPHLTGQAIDIGKRGMTLDEIAWMRAYLKPLMDAGKLDVEEEFQQACFHISVYKAYAPAPRHGAIDVAQVRKPLVGTESSR